MPDERIRFASMGRASSRAMKTRWLVYGAVAGVASAIAIAYGVSHTGPTMQIGTSSRPQAQPRGKAGGIAHGAQALPRSANAGRPAQNPLERFLDLKARAENHDPAAQYDLSELYGLCQQVNLDPARFVGTYEAIAKQSRDAANAQRLREMSRRVETTCSSVDSGAVIPKEAAILWRKAAADSGSLSAVAKQYMLSQDKPTGAALQGFMDQVVASKDPQSVFELGQLISATEAAGNVGRYGAVVGDPLSGYAWSVTACRMGLDCGSGSFVMDSVCLNTGYCTSGSFEEFVRTGLISTADQAVLDAKVDNIVSLLSKQ